jgi:integrase
VPDIAGKHLVGCGSRWQTGWICQRVISHTPTPLRYWKKPNPAWDQFRQIEFVLTPVPLSTGPFSAGAWVSIPSLRYTDARETARERVLTEAEIAEVWRAAARLGVGDRDAHEQDLSYWTALIRILLLTGQRRGEVAGMRCLSFVIRSTGA